MSNIVVPLTYATTEEGQPRSVMLVAVVNPDGTPLAGGSSGESDALTNAQLRASAVPVSGPLTNAQLAAITGAANATMWDGLTPSATLISILKAMHEQNEALKRIGNETNTLLVQVAEHTRQIAANTAPAAP